MKSIINRLLNRQPPTVAAPLQPKEWYFTHTKPDGVKVVRVVKGKLKDSFLIDYTKSLEEIHAEVDQLLRFWIGNNVETIIEQLGEFPNTGDIGVHAGGNHIDIVWYGKGSLGWLTVLNHRLNI